MSEADHPKILVVEAFRDKDRIKLSTQEGNILEHSSLEHYEERRLNWNWVCQHSTAISKVMSTSNAGRRLADSGFRELKRLGGILLDELFPPEMKEQLFSSKTQDMIIRIDDGLVHVPWELLYDGEQFFCLRWDMGRVVRTKQKIYRTRPRSLDLPLKMFLVADPRGNLPAAYQEGLLIRRLLEAETDKILLETASHRVQAGCLRAKLKACDVLHYAGHAEYFASQPTQSGMLLEDGKLTAGEIIQLAGGQGAPSLVFVNGCKSGRTKEWKTKEALNQEIFGLGNAFLLAGARHYIGTFSEVQDDLSTQFALQFYEALRSGSTVGRSLTNARKEIMRRFGESTVVWASYMLYGDPSFRYFDLETARSESTVSQFDLLEQPASSSKDMWASKPSSYDKSKSRENPSIDYSLSKSYTPKFLAEKILTNRESIQGERKLVTGLLATLADYSSLAHEFDPEDIHEIMDGCLRILIDEIHRYEGTIVRFTGEGLIAFFGAPVAHEDHALRACYAALSIQKAVREHADNLRMDRAISLEMRIGINSGPVIVGRIGDDLTMSFTDIADTTDALSRLSNLAQPGTVLISAHTQRMASGYFEFEPFDILRADGRKELNGVYELLRSTDVETRIEVAAARGLTRLVGRRNEMDVLLEAFDEAQFGSGQVVGIVGDPGVGKSRLLLELRSTLAVDGCRCLQGRCRHYGDSMPYLPVLDFMKTYFDIEEKDEEPTIKRKLDSSLRDLDEKVSNILPGLHEILSLKVEDENWLQQGPQQKKEQTFAAICGLLFREADNRPLLLVIEDLHWIDKTSEEFLNYLISVLPNTRTLLILLYRPEYAHSWGDRPYYTQLSLGQLTPRKSEELVRAIFEEGQVDPELRDLVLSRAGGNPLFVEELTRSLVESGSIQRKNQQYYLTRKSSKIEVPDTIQGIIAARIDRLEENSKRVIQVASVIGREFTYRILATLTGVNEKLNASLQSLQGSQFIYEKQLFPELEYIFKHALTQEVAYKSLLLKRRKEIHEDIGRAIETLYPERLEEYYELLAYHYVRSGNKQRALEYLDLTNQKAAKASAMEDAKSHFDAAMELLDSLSDTEENRQRRISLLVNQSTVFQLLFKHPEYHELLNRYESLVTELPDSDLTGVFYARLAQCECALGNFRKAILVGGKAARLCEADGSPEMPDSPTPCWRLRMCGPGISLRPSCSSMMCCE